MDQLGRVYVTDMLNHRVQRFSLDGTFLQEWGTKGTGPGEFEHPLGIAVSSEEAVYVVDSDNARIQVFDPDGNPISVIGPDNDAGALRQPIGVALDSRDTVYVVDRFGQRVRKFDRQGRFINDWGSTGVQEGFMDFPQDCAVGPTGDVFVSDYENKRVQRFDAEGNFVLAFGEAGNGPGQFTSPEGIAVDNAGNVYVADLLSPRILKFTQEGAFIHEWGGIGAEEGKFRGLGYLAVDESGHVYAADAGNNRIQKFDAEGNFVLAFGEAGVGPGQFQVPQGIAIGIDGDLYVTEIFGHRVQRFTAEGEPVLMWGREGNLPGEFNRPGGIAVDASGLVYVADGRNDRIQRFTPDGVFIDMLGATGSDPGKFAWPTGLALGAESQLYVVDSFNARVQVFRPAETIPSRKALLISGAAGAREAQLSDAVRMCMNLAYRALVHQGLSKEDIFVLSSDDALDLDGNGLFDDVDGPPTSEAVATLLTTGARGADEVLVYLAGRIDSEGFVLSDSEHLEAEAFGSALDSVRAAGGVPIVLLDAGNAESFLAATLARSARGRIHIASAKDGEQAFFATNGTLSFSNVFWVHVLNGKSLHDAFMAAQQAMGTDSSYQTPTLDGNGNGIGNEDEDFQAAQASYIFNETRSGDMPPSIAQVSAPQTISHTESTVEIFAEGVADDTDRIARVWGVITPPGGREGAENAVTALPTVELDLLGPGRYEAIAHLFEEPGLYLVDVYALDGNLNISTLARTSVEKAAVPGTLVVAVVDALTRMPIPEARVWLTQGLLVIEATRVADGSYPFLNVPPGWYQVRIESPGYDTYTQLVELPAGGMVEREFALGSEGTDVGCCAASSTEQTGAVKGPAPGDTLVVLASFLLVIRAYVRHRLVVHSAREVVQQPQLH